MVNDERVCVGEWVDPYDQYASFPDATRWHSHNVSGAVGAICRHSRVLFAIASRDSPGMYLNISSTVWPPVPRKLRSPICIQVGLVSHPIPPVFLALPNMALGRGCCGNVTPAGSLGPGRRLIGRDVERRSDRMVDSV